MYHVSTHGVDERMINVHYYYYFWGFNAYAIVALVKRSVFTLVGELQRYIGR